MNKNRIIFETAFWSIVLIVLLALLVVNIKTDREAREIYERQELILNQFE